MSECKFLIFTDLHYSPGEFLGGVDQRLYKIMQRAEEKNISFVIHLGDMLHEQKHNRWLAGVYLDNPLPTYSAIGNHDNDEVDVDEITRMYRIPNNYYYYDRDGYRFLVLDPNYTKINGEFVHYEPGQERRDGNAFLTPEQLKWMEKTIFESQYPCVIFSHQSLERTDGIVNRDEAWKIISAANRRKKNSVILCVNGHYHCDACNFVNDVCCLDLNSASYHWTDVENHHYPKEYYDEVTLIRFCLYYDTGLSAVITLKDTDSIIVDGCSGKFMFQPEQEEIERLDQRRLSPSRITVPYISNYEVDLKALTILKRAFNK